MEANETHPATINCHVDCLSSNIMGTYNPILLLINAKDAERLEIPAASANKADYYMADFRQFNSCNASNNYADYEYDIYLLGDRLDNVVIACGIVHPNTGRCWGQTHAVVSYSTDNPVTTTMSPCPTTADPSTTTPPTTLPLTITDQPTTIPPSTPPSATTGLVTTTNTIIAGTANSLASSFTPTVSSLAVVIIILAVGSVIIITVLGCRLKQMYAKNKVFIAPILTDNAINNRASQDTYC